jgi:hypothetical protein
MSLTDPIIIVQKLTTALESLGLPYMIGGSLASSFHGIPRATQDVDVVVAMAERQIPPLEAALSSHFYFDVEMAKDAVRRRSSFNIIDKEEFFKVDIFIQKDDEISSEEMGRRIKHHLAETPDQSMYVCSPEDIIAHKLFWYNLGGRVSERQLNDAFNVFKVQKNRLDWEYLKRICGTRGVLDLMHKLIGNSDSPVKPPIENKQ